MSILAFSSIANHRRGELNDYQRPPPLHRDQDRPYVSIASMGFPDILIKPGPTIIHCDIKNSGRTPAKIVDSNMTLFFETDSSPLPSTPRYSLTPHRLSGDIYGDIYTA